MLPDLDSLRCFDAAANQMSFRRAAKTVALSPAAFGERIKRLEEQVGEPLFLRTTRRVALTSAGERLLPHARLTLEAARQCLSLGGATPCEFTLGTRYELGLSWLVPLLAPLRARHPEWTIHVFFGDSPDLLGRVKRGLLDAAVTSTRLAVAGLDYATLHAEDYAFVGSPRLLKGGRLRQPGDAREQVLLDVSPDLPLFRYFLDARPSHETWAFGRTEYLGGIGAIRYRAVQGAGVAVLPRYFVAEDLRRNRLAELFPRARLQEDAFRLLWRREHPRQSVLVDLAAELRTFPLR